MLKAYCDLHLHYTASVFFHAEEGIRNYALTRARGDVSERQVLPENM